MDETDTFITALLKQQGPVDDQECLLGPKARFADDTESVGSQSVISLENNSFVSSLSAHSKDQIKLPSMREKYFGQEARLRFFSRLQFMTKQRNISSSSTRNDAQKQKQRSNQKSRKCEVLDDCNLLFFDNEDTEQIDFPFSISRPTSPFIDFERYASLDSANTHGQQSYSGDYSTKSDADASFGDFSASGSSTPTRQTDDNGSFSPRSASSFPQNSLGTTGTSFVSKYDEDFPDPSVAGFPQSLACPLSPRTKFIATCLNNNVNPRSCLILRRKFDGVLDLQHLGMGDKLASVLASCLAELPLVNELNINNNNLSDVGVFKILECVQNMPQLQVLNVSRNKMDDLASDALAEFVQSDACSLTTLIMQQSDIDDNEGLRLLRCLQRNKSITALDLSENKIGGVESMRSSLRPVLGSNSRSVGVGGVGGSTTNTTQQTCAEAFAEFLSNSSVHQCVLKSLNLSWNMIRLGCSTALCKSIASNASLTDLNLSFNSLGDTAECLGSALMENKTLIKLNLASCGVTTSACLVLAIGAIECPTLRWLMLDSNPIGRDGANALLLIPMSVGPRVSVSSKKCNIRMSATTVSNWFSIANPLGTFHLELSKDYDRAIAFALLDVAANHSTYVIKSCEYQTSANAKREKLELFQCSLHSTANVDDDQRETLKALQRIKAGGNDTRIWRQLFEESDENGDGHIDAEELQHLLQRLGFIGSDGFNAEILDQYGQGDGEDDNCICLPGFVAFLKNEYENVCERIEELTNTRIMSSSPDPARPVHYRPPKSGILHLTLVDGLQKKSKARVVSKGIAEAAREIGGNEKKMLLKFTMDSSIFRLNEALMIFKMLYDDGAGRHACISEVLQRLDTPTEVRSFLRKVLHNYDYDMLMLKKFMGAALKPILGHFNGYYCLDLGNSLDQFCLRKLILHNESAIVSRKPASSSIPFGDTSQKRNWSCFRNVYRNGVPFNTDPASMGDSIPSSGKLSFDFASVARPTNGEDTVCVSDQRFIHNLAVKLGLLHTNQRGEAARFLHDKKLELAKGLLFPNTTERNEWSESRAKKVRDSLDAFYSKQNARRATIEAALDRLADLLVQPRSPRKQLSRSRLLTTIQTDAPTNEGLSKPDEVDKSNDETQANGGDSPATPKRAPTMRMALTALSQSAKLTGESAASPAGNASSGGASRNTTTRLPALSMTMSMTAASSKPSNAAQSLLVRSFTDAKGEHEARLFKSLHAIEDSLGHLWLRCRHVICLLKYFEESMDHFLGASYGSFAVELVVVLHPRIVDLHNFDSVLVVLSSEDVGALFGRLGWLNAFNPMKPNGFWVLRMDINEERLVAKCLLATHRVENGGIKECFQMADSSPRSGKEPDMKMISIDPSVPLVESLLPPSGKLYINFIRRSDEYDLDLHPSSRAAQSADDHDDHDTVNRTDGHTDHHEGSAAGAGSGSGYLPVPAFRRSLTLLTLVSENALGFEDSKLLKQLMSDQEHETHTSQKLKYTANLASDYVDTDDVSKFHSVSEAFDNSLKRSTYKNSVKLALRSARKMMLGSRVDSVVSEPFDDFGALWDASGREHATTVAPNKIMLGMHDRMLPERSMIWETFLVRDNVGLPTTSGSSVGDSASSTPRKDGTSTSDGARGATAGGAKKGKGKK